MFFPRNVHTERFRAGPCMACDHAPKEKKNYGKKTWEKWGKLGIGGKNIWEKMEKIGYSMGKKVRIWEKLGKVPVHICVYNIC